MHSSQARSQDDVKMTSYVDLTSFLLIDGAIVVYTCCLGSLTTHIHPIILNALTEVNYRPFLYQTATLYQKGIFSTIQLLKHIYCNYI